jgi:hypothetical protein
MATPPTVAAPGPPPDEPRAHITRGRGGVALLGSVGSAPNGSVGLLIKIGIRRFYWSLDLEARVDAVGSSGAALAGLYGGALVPCLHRSLFALCQVTTIGSLFARAPGGTLTATGPLVALGARGGVELALPHSLELQVHVDLAFAVLRPTLASTPPLDTPLFTAQLAVGMVGYFK